ncbi:hypothetical protein ABZ885_39605, partial [Kitasatospora sp. NPDC047058]
MEQSDGAVLELGWSGQLPKPEVEGSRAVYRGVVAEGAGDLVATALPTGLRFDVVLNRRPAGLVEIKVPVIGKGLRIGKEDGGRLTVKDGDTVIATSSAPVLYDADSPLARHPGKDRRDASVRVQRGHVGDVTADVTGESAGPTGAPGPGRGGSACRVGWPGGGAG